MKRARIRGIEMAYEMEGNGPTIVLLHGFPFNRSLWSEQVEALSDSYRVITPDLRGFGETSAQSEQPATMREMAEDVAALMDEIGTERFALGGLSMGGYVSLAFYRHFPLRVRALVLADTRPQDDTDEARGNRERQAQQAIRENSVRAIVDVMLPKLLAPATLNERKDVTERLQAMMMSTSPQGAAAALRGMAERPDQTYLLPRILAPTLIIVGDLDQITPLKDAELMHREIRGSRLEVIEGAGHVSNLERPSEFNHALRNFLDALQP